MELVESTWRVCEGVTLKRWMLSPERESWTVRWTTTGDEWRQRAGLSAAEVLRVAADEAPGRYRDALLAAAADPPSVPVVSSVPDGSTIGCNLRASELARENARLRRIVDDAMSRLRPTPPGPISARD